VNPRENSFTITNTNINSTITVVAVRRRLVEVSAVVLAEQLQLVPHRRALLHRSYTIITVEPISVLYCHLSHLLHRTIQPRTVKSGLQHRQRLPSMITAARVRAVQEQPLTQLVTTTTIITAVEGSMAMFKQVALLPVAILLVTTLEILSSIRVRVFAKMHRRPHRLMTTFLVFVTFFHHNSRSKQVPSENLQMILPSEVCL